MADPIDVTETVRVPASAIEARAVRSSGPGGQNVNTVASKVLVEVDLARVEGLDDAARRRLATLAGRRLGADGILRITAQASRDRFRNLESAREKVQDLLEKAQVPPKVRQATRASRSEKERRLRAKKRDAAVKEGRRGVREED